ncbi:MAG: hypothetical protein KF708_01220 [Pirellulales bacterium]|nr:hypothetical protein [Pirellulales bacterium]
MQAGLFGRLAVLVGLGVGWMTAATGSPCQAWQRDAGSKQRGVSRSAPRAAATSVSRDDDRIELSQPKPKAAPPTATPKSKQPRPAQAPDPAGPSQRSPAPEAAAKAQKNNPRSKSEFTLSWENVEALGDKIGQAIATGLEPVPTAPKKETSQGEKGDPRIAAREKSRQQAAGAKPTVAASQEPGMAVASDAPAAAGRARQSESATPPTVVTAPSAPAVVVPPAVTAPSNSGVAVASDVPSGATLDDKFEAPQPSAAPATVSTAVEEAPDTSVARVTVEIEPAHFNEVQPGTTTAEELSQAWGPPRQIVDSNGRVEQMYAIEPFELVVVTLIDDLVSSIFVSFREPVAADRLAIELGMKDIPPVIVPDEVGTPLGEVYPERGVLFSYAPESKRRQVARIILEEIDAEPFVRRGEALLQLHYQLALGDLDTALRLDSTQHRAHWLRAQLFSDTGREHEALVAVEAALEQVPLEAEYLLTKAKILSLTGKYADALAQCDAVLALAKLPVATEARATLLKGDIVAAGPARDYKRAMEHHVQAIKLARPLVEEAKVAERRAAQEVLVSAHLSVARDIAWGSWNHKEDVVPKWIAQADEIAAAAVQRGDAPGDYHFRICQQALAAYVGMQGAADPTYWTEETVKTGQQLIDQATDPWYRRRLEWELGMVLYDAVQVYHMRREYGRALEYGPLAVKFLREAESDRRDLPGHDYLMGRLYFRLGAIHLAHAKDHGQAISWFNQAVPLMEQPIPASAMADIGRQGETFVSMAVSYWETGDREEAVRLTTRGVELMERAVDKGILHPEALAIGYGNLSSMHAELGHAQEAESYDELASRSELSITR